MFDVLGARPRLNLLRHCDLASGFRRAAEFAQRCPQRVMCLDVIGVKLDCLAQRFYRFFGLIEHQLRLTKLKQRFFIVGISRNRGPEMAQSFRRIVLLSQNLPEQAM